MSDDELLSYIKTEEEVSAAATSSHDQGGRGHTRSIGITLVIRLMTMIVLSGHHYM